MSLVEILLLIIAICCAVMATETFILGGVAYMQRRRDERARKLAAAVYAKVQAGEIPLEDALAQIREQAQ